MFANRVDQWEIARFSSHALAPFAVAGRDELPDPIAEGSSLGNRSMRIGLATRLCGQIGAVDASPVKPQPAGVRGARGRCLGGCCGRQQGHDQE